MYSRTRHTRNEIEYKPIPYISQIKRDNNKITSKQRQGPSKNSIDSLKEITPGPQT